jgi:ribosomal protein L13E
MTGKYPLTGHRPRRTLWIRDQVGCSLDRAKSPLSDPSNDLERSMMSNTIQVSAARIPDRDRLLRELEEAGVKAKPVDELGIAVKCADGDDAASDEIFAHVERVIMSIGASFVPTKHEDVIYIRPPVG